MKTEEFPIDEEKLDQLIDVLHRKKQTLQGDGGYVYVNLSMVRLQIMWVLPKILYAMGVAEAMGARVIVLTWRENALFDRLAEALGVEHVVLEKIDHGDPAALFKAGLKSAFWLAGNSRGESFQKVRIMGIPVGQFIYEDILRTSSLSTIRSIRNKICIKKIIHLLWMIYALQAYLQKKKPVFVVADDIAYHEGMQNILFFKAGAEIYSQHIYGESKVYFDRKDRIARRGKLMNMLIRKQLDSVSGEAEKRAEEMLTARFAGKGGRELDRGAFAGKRVLNRQETMELLGLPSDKKNIVIMAHTFTDAVFNYGQLYYRDYYDWLEQTLQIAGKNDKVNWILKPHPTRSAYNESEDSIEKMYEKHRRDNIFFLPDHVSAESIRDIADVIVTIGGNAGAEFACFGIPAVIIGEPYYKGFGYTLEPRSRMEYEQLLMHIEETEPLKEEQILTAKKVFYMNAQKQLEGKAFSDEFASILLEENQNMNDQIAVQLFENNKGTQAYNDTVMDSITGYFSAHGIEECEYYQRGKMRGYHRQKI